MKQFNNPLDNIKVASPCPADWNQMVGDDRTRFCSQCELNVYNLSDMTSIEAQTFLMENEGSVCVKFYRRKDGTVLTKDCPVGWQKLKRKVSKVATATFASMFGLFGGIFAFNQTQFEPLNLDTVTVDTEDLNFKAVIPTIEVPNFVDENEHLNVSVGLTVIEVDKADK